VTSTEIQALFGSSPEANAWIDLFTEEALMSQSAGALLDREISRRVLGLDREPVPPYSTEDRAADLLLWRLSQRGIAFKVQELDGQHYCMLWSGGERGLSTGCSPSRPLAICRAAMDLSERASFRVSAAGGRSAESRG